jgi:hypothetical protein
VVEGGDGGLETQIPCGDDRKKSKGDSKGKDFSGLLGRRFEAGTSCWSFEMRKGLPVRAALSLETD